jgi:hypothetical protein
MIPRNFRLTATPRGLANTRIYNDYHATFDAHAVKMQLCKSEASN